MKMKELIEYRSNKRKQKCLQHHKTMVAIHGYCKPFNQSEYNKVATKQKASFTKGKGFAFKGLWNHNNINFKTV
jgi:hypothetical protein